MGGISGEEALVVPDQNEGTGDSGDVTLGVGSHSVIAIDGTLPAENVAKSISLPVYGVGKLVSSVNSGGGLCQSKAGGVPMRFWSMDSIPCMGAFTCAASCASSWCIRLSRAA